MRPPGLETSEFLEESRFRAHFLSEKNSSVKIETCHQEEDALKKENKLPHLLQVPKSCTWRTARRDLFSEIRTRQRNKPQPAKILPCCDMNCIHTCQKRDRCIHKQIINKQHKKVIKKTNKKGKNCLIVEEHCKKRLYYQIFWGKSNQRKERKLLDTTW